MSTREKEFNITAGPGKDLLFDACKYAYGNTGHISIEFSIIDSNGYDGSMGSLAPVRIDDLRIVSIENEDGSGESFNLAGYCWGDLDEDQGGSKPYRFKAYYSTRKRCGQISLIEI